MRSQLIDRSRIDMRSRSGGGRLKGAAVPHLYGGAVVPQCAAVVQECGSLMLMCKARNTTSSGSHAGATELRLPQGRMLADIVRNVRSCSCRGLRNGSSTKAVTCTHSDGKCNIPLN